MRLKSLKSERGGYQLHPPRYKTIAYDNIGNPTSYLGATLTWEGRQLTSYSNDEHTFNYEYDENGMRYRTTITNKEDNSVGYLDYADNQGTVL